MSLLGENSFYLQNINNFIKISIENVFLNVFAVFSAGPISTALQAKWSCIFIFLYSNKQIKIQLTNLWIKKTERVMKIKDSVLPLILK